SIRHLADGVSLDENLMALGDLVPLGIEHSKVSEQDLRQIGLPHRATGAARLEDQQARVSIGTKWSGIVRRDPMKCPRLATRSLPREGWIMANEIALTEAELNVLKRIERLPFGRFHWRLLAMGGLGYTFDAIDGAMIAFILPAVSALWGLTNQVTGVLGS